MLRAAVAGTREMLFPAIPVCLAAGIGLWFGLAREPGAQIFLCAGAVLLSCAALSWFGPEVTQPAWIGIGCLAAGLMLAGARAHLVAAPVLDFHYYGPVQGRVIGIDRSQTDALRLTLDRVVLTDVAPVRHPARLRISLHGPQFLQPEPGQIVQVTAHLSAPEGPVEPGGFDFRRMAWFLRLGAIGYARTPVVLWQDAVPGTQVLNRLRRHLAGAVQAAIPGDAGAFAAGVMTGDRSGLSLPSVEALRASSLAHLLAISGMNMAFLTSFVFAMIRTGIALVPPVALRVNAKKIAAVVAFAVAFFYLLLSGANVATERAFVMVAVMLGAVLLDRRPLSMRSLGLAAILLLVLRPESLLDAGFQMSFAATTALIAGFSVLDNAMLRARLPRWAWPILTLVLSSALAGLATAPFGAAHFNRIADFGFLANLLTVPVMGAVVMPAGAIAGLLAPLGLAGPALWLMGLGCSWILEVAHVVAGWEGAVTGVPAPGPWVLPLTGLGGIWLAAGKGWGRLPGLGGILAALFLWSGVERPLLLVSPDAALVGLLGPEGRALSSPRGAGFAARSWLENDGDLAEQQVAAERPGFTGTAGQRHFQLSGLAAVHLKGKAATGIFEQACQTADLVIVAADIPPGSADCIVIDRGLLATTGGLAIDLREGALHFQAAQGQDRIWTRRKGASGSALVPAPIPIVRDQ